MIKIGRIMMGICQTNCYFLYEEGKKDVIFVDPADKGDVLFEKLETAGFHVAGIILTHGHFDHIWGLEKLKELTGAKVYAYEGEKELLNDSGMNVSEQFNRPCQVDADVYLKDGDCITIAGMTAKLIATPGHTGGSCCYYFEKDKILLSGDTLFEGSVGRTDFPTGSMSLIVRSIQEKLFVLPDDVTVYPGHGGQTTIGDEKKYNPCCS